ncbi:MULTISPECIES: DUF5719 family protein [unclassified Luteococcus]|uniref:DUF5719 family protein n=1 Tax=unclassified Luteococcus TaxID=2639923 RepID=UPI00313B4931
MTAARDLLPAVGVLLTAAGLTVAALTVPPLSTGADGAPGAGGSQSLAPQPSTHALACPSAPPGQSAAQLLDNSASAEKVAVGHVGNDVAAAARLLPAGQHQAVGGVWLTGAPRADVSWWGPCLPGAADQLVQLANPTGAKLLLANPGASDARVDLTLYGAQGPVRAIGTSGITVPAGAQQLVPISVQAPAGKPVGARIVASQGRVAAWAMVDDGGGADYLPAATVLGSQVLPAVPMGGTSQVLLTNPGEQRSTVKLTAHGRRGAFQPTGAAETIVEPGSTVLADVSRSFAGEVGSLSLASDQPVAASLWSRVGKDLALAPGMPLLGGGELVLPAAATVILTNPAGADQQVQVRQSDGSQKEWTVPGGGVVTIEPQPTTGQPGTAAPGLIRFTGGQVAAGAVVTGAGTSLVPAQGAAAARGDSTLRQDPALR